MKNKLTILLILIFAFTSINAQMARKPSPTREPKGVMNKKPDSNKRYLLKIKSRKDFDSMARIYHQKTPYALPHAMFAIDRRNKNKIYYINSQKYRFHKDFLIGNYLFLKGKDFFQNVYINPNRRFIVGTIAWQKTVDKFTFEFWEGDLIPAEQIRLTYNLINKTFYEKVAFKPNSIRHDELTAKMLMKRVTSDEISKNQEYLALNTGKTVGRVHIIDDVKEIGKTIEVGYNEILIMKEVPFSLPPVRGIIMTRPTTPLSHINLLAKGWGIPNVYIKDADKLFKEYDTWWVEFESSLTDYKIKRADKTTPRPASPFKSPPSNLAAKNLATLWQMRKRDSKIYGAKAANLGEVKRARIPNVTVPRGFAIPFRYYDEFMKTNGFEEEIKDLMFDMDFVHNPRVRRQKLKEFRAKIQKGKFNEKLKREILTKWKTYLGGKGVFVRSSSNAEDMPNFSGAGLYTTVPNVKESDAIIEAVKTVWGSLWNFEAYETRERRFVEHIGGKENEGVYMGVLIQIGVNMDNGGVLITKDPFDRENKGAVYIAANWGHNLCVVGGEDCPKNERIPEQVLYSPKSNAVQVLTRSNQDSILKFDEKGGLVEMPISKKRSVLTDAVVRRLVKASNKIKRVFGNKKEQDIEWGYKAGRIYILQSRPYIEN